MTIQQCIYALEIHNTGSFSKAAAKLFVAQSSLSNSIKSLEDELEIRIFERSKSGTVLTVDGETADEAAQEWWCFTKDGEMLMTGVDDTMIADGEQYEVKLAVGW